jgi:hypothetical protein
MDIDRLDRFLVIAEVERAVRAARQAELEAKMAGGS